VNPLAHPAIRRLDPIVQRLNLAVGQAQLDKVPIRSAFLKAWTDYVAGWRENAENVASAVPIAKLQARLEKWIDAFVAEGIIPDPTVHPVAAGGDTDPLIWTPSAITAELEKVRTEYELFNKDINADPDSKPIDPSREPNPTTRRRLVSKLAADWSPTYDEFSAWYKSGPSTLWGATAAKAKEYEARGRNYAEQFEKAGGGGAPGGGAFSLNRPQPGQDKMPSWEKGVIAGLALILGIMVLPKIIPERKRVTA
jgi:hypothetical protein